MGTLLRELVFAALRNIPPGGTNKDAHETDGFAGSVIPHKRFAVVRTERAARSAALKVRARQYLTQSLSVEAAAGFLRANVGGFSEQASTGFTANLRVNAADKLSLFVAYDDMRWPDAQ